MTDETDPQAVTSGTVADLKDHIETVQTPEELEAIRAAEQDGKARPTALAAIDAKADELAPDTGKDTDKDPIETAQNDPASLTDEQIATIAGTDKSHETSNEDAKETLELQREQAIDPDREPPADTIFHGQGGGFGL